ncbi:class I SAM-dependent methyltransferase [Brevibacillus reuszeri]|uniref:class I SAM-dependent methyltransferase n=1 Tax=Brevibacillus reuszeri TaxID=54915 RepID=UPI0028A29398|nr:class I SAM-dependent methyltransferase [Brevibacillus reuszeri]
MNNLWNKVIYQVWAPFYDTFFNSGSFLKARKKIFEDLTFPANSQILLVGVGTGADLPFVIEKVVSITAIDLSPEMLDQAKEKYESPSITFKIMDAQDLEFPSESFEFVIANLILSVVPDPDQCFREMIRVTRSGGKIVIFDKFVPLNQELSLIMKILRPIIGMLGTDIGRRFEQIVMPYAKSIVIEEDSPSLFNGMYRKIIIRKI